MSTDAPPRLHVPIRRRLRKWRHTLRNQNRINSVTSSGIKIVLLHQMGKVGSSSVRESLRAMEAYHVFHTHWCNSENLSRPAGVVDESRRVSNRYGDRDHFGEMINQQIIQPGLASRMVTLVRDPVARNISSYFQHLDEIWGVHRAHERVPLVELLSGFLQVFEHDEPLDWFETEIAELIGIDVFAHRFDAAKKYSFMSNADWSLLLMRSDLPDSRKRTALEELLGDRVPNLYRKNIGSMKAYASIYDEFKRELVLPTSYLDRMYNAPVTTHFYATEEIDDMRRRWTRVPYPVQTVRLSA